MGVYIPVSKKRFNIWLDKELIEAVKAASKKVGLKASSYMRMAILEKINGRQKDVSGDSKSM